MIALSILKNTCILGINSTWSWYISFLMCCWILFARNLLKIFTLMFITDIGVGNGTPLQYSCLENPMGGGAWWAAVHGVANSRAWLRDFTFAFHFHALEKEMATQSNILAWRIPGTGETGGLPSMGSHRVRHDWSDLAAAVAVITDICLYFSFFMLPFPNFDIRVIVASY